MLAAPRARNCRRLDTVVLKALRKIRAPLHGAPLLDDIELFLIRAVLAQPDSRGTAR